MLNTEIAELMNKDGQMFDWASKIEHKRNLSNEEKEISTVVDAWAKEIGEKGSDNDCELSNFITKTIQPEVYDKPDALLSTMFDRGSVDEFDDFEVDVDAKNTLKAYNAAKGGNVPKSYLDTSVLKPTWAHKQIETEIKYSELRRNGYRTVASLTTFAQESLMNAMISNVFNTLDAAITGGDQVVAITGSTLDKTSLDKLALYTIDNATTAGDTPFAFALNKYAQMIANMANYTTFMSDNMKDDYNRYGFVKEYGGLLISGISGAKKTALNELLVPDKRIFGVSGKIGEIDMRGALRTYVTPDNNLEKFVIKVTGFEFGTCITRPEKVAKITFTA